MKKFREFCLLASILAIVTFPAASQAQYYLTANDSIGTSSFNAAGHWTSGAAPSPGNTYTTEHWLLRSPASSGSYIFQGDSLTIGGTDGTAGVNPFSESTPNNDSLIFKASAVTLTVTNLILDGGAVRDGNGDGQYTYLDGNLYVTTNGGAFMAQDSNIINSAISGPGPIYIGDNGNGNAQRVIIFTSGSSTYNGSIILNPQGGTPGRSRLTLAPGSIMNFTIGLNGTNNSISGGGTLSANGAWNINLAGADNTIGDAWTINGAATNTTYGPTFSINGFSQEASDTNLWNDFANGVLYEYNQTNGQLTVSSGDISISQQPISESVAPGNLAELSVSAAGPLTLDYQWYFLTGTSPNPISGATNASYSTETSVLGTTNYFVVITNGISPAVTSAVVSITVRAPRSLEWAGVGSSWDTSSANWTLGGSPTAYVDADDVTFDNTGAAQPAVSLTQALHPTTVTVSGSTSYT
ncbi:MAG: hypothetical protein ACRED1_04650, partial [Limisphaerales bacterium]